MKRNNTNDAISQFLVIEDKPEKADLIFVLGSEYFPKMDLATKLYKKGFAPTIFISGGSYKGKKRAMAESEEFAKYAISKGVDAKDIFVETKATNTLENMVFSKPIIAKQIGWKKIKKIIFICHSFHARRVLMTAEKHWPKGIEYRFSTIVDARKITPTDWWKTKSARERIYGELKRIGEYAMKGDI